LIGNIGLFRSAVWSKYDELYAYVKGKTMKFQRLFIAVLIIICVIVTFSETYSQSYGRIRALKERAITVIQQKNNFVTRVLDSYGIPYERNDEGVVIRIGVDNQWNDVTRLDIVPLVNDDEKGFRVTAHNIFFDTNRGMFHLVSQLIIR
jgi:hypothetical protein